jgi:hypothetical protein
MRQAKPFFDRHRFLPFARRFDDQHARAGIPSLEAGSGL